MTDTVYDIKKKKLEMTLILPRDSSVSQTINGRKKIQKNWRKWCDFLPYSVKAKDSYGEKWHRSLLSKLMSLWLSLIIKLEKMSIQNTFHTTETVLQTNHTFFILIAFFSSQKQASKTRLLTQLQ